MRSFAQVRSLRFEWQKLITPLTSKAVVAEYTQKQSEITSMLSAARSVPKKVEPIDWDHWKSVISTPGVVDEMQKEYESMKFPKAQAFTPEANAKIAEIEAEIAMAKAQASLGASEIAAADKELARMDVLKSEATSAKDIQDLIPGLEQQHKNEYNDEDYVPTDAEEKLGFADWNAASAEIAEGKDPEIGVRVEALGDMSYAEEEEIAKSGKWSIARLFASKEERAAIQEKTEKIFAA